MNLSTRLTRSLLALVAGVVAALCLSTAPAMASVEEHYYYDYQPTFTTEYEMSYTVYGSWSAWQTYQVTGCRSQAPALPANTPTTQYQSYGYTTPQCNVGQMKWNLQSRTRSVGTAYVWRNCNCPQYGETWTGNTEQVVSGTVRNEAGDYWDVAPHDAYDVDSGLTRTV